MAAEEDKKIADNIIQCLQVLNKNLKDAERLGLKVDVDGYFVGIRKVIEYRAKIYRRTDEVIAHSPKD